jgi:adenosylcobinamide kinase/adenosylcobinamide-phosphate guanylyltransferase
VILVGNETGLGIVPDNALARRFRDENGRLNQIVAPAPMKCSSSPPDFPLALKSPLI